MNPDAFIYPRGELQPAWFGTDDIGLVTLVSTWLDEGATAATEAGLTGDKATAATRAVVYARGYRAAADGLHAMPTSSSLPDGNSWSFSEDQRDYWRGRAAQWEGRLAVLLGTVTGRVQGTHNRRVRSVW